MASLLALMSAAMCLKYSSRAGGMALSASLLCCVSIQSFGASRFKFKIFCMRLSSRWKKLAKISLVKMALEISIIVLSVGVCSEGWEGGGVEAAGKYSRAGSKPMARLWA